jgi:PKHD-type hydroxylase
MHFIKTVTNFLTPVECDGIINTFHNSDLKQGEIGSNKKGEDLKFIRDSKILFVEIDWLKSKLESFLRNEIKVKGYELDNIESFQFTKYGLGGHYGWHTDANAETEFNERFCSVVIQLNNDYTGGELLYKNIDDDVIIFERGCGNMFIFNSKIEHKVNPINTGVRYSIVTWIKLREIKEFKKTLL